MSEDQAAADANDPQMTDFVEGEFLTEQVIFCFKHRVVVGGINDNHETVKAVIVFNRNVRTFDVLKDIELIFVIKEYEAIWDQNFI
uniref:Uncharacterized protein n=1 Tax=Physcomitrium patens TaxID=3218 RepID=A0A7I4EGA1_PHYPA